MSVLDLFSHRKREAEGNTPDVFVYDELPKTLRIQIIHILRASIGPYYVYTRHTRRVTENNAGWQEIHNALAREHGVFSLGESHSIDDNCLSYFHDHTDVNKALDVIEACFLYIDGFARRLDRFRREDRGITQTADSAIAELNERFLRAGVGYQFESGHILRVDSELVHSEVVKPALQYLNEPGFEGPRDEFMRAHGHYRSGEIEDAVTDANNAFESTLKAVCDQCGWDYSKGARASDLLKIIRKRGLLPEYLDNSFNQLAATLQSGLPQVRNWQGGHGQGAKPRNAPDYVGAYALHLAAANILFIVKAHKALG